MDIHIERKDLTDFIQGLLTDATYYSVAIRDAIKGVESHHELKADESIEEAWKEAKKHIVPEAMSKLLQSIDMSESDFYTRLETARCFHVINNIEFNQIMKEFKSLYSKSVINNGFTDWLDEMETFLYTLFAERMKDG